MIILIHLIALIISLLPTMVCASREAVPRYAVALIPTPVLNTPGLAAVFGGRDGSTLRLDRCGQIREMEFVALPGTTFSVEAAIPAGTALIYRVTTVDYPYPSKSGYFIDSRFVTSAFQLPPSRPRLLPSRQAVIDRLLAARGSRYVWGGNARSGLPQLLSHYPPATPLTPDLAELWQLRGVDCSGLLYEATDGFTPRNTSALVDYGRPVAIAGLRPAQIASRVEPLDLIVWQGHVMIVIDRERVIESRLACGKPGGVRVRPLRAALEELCRAREPADEVGKEGERRFAIRRWYKP